MARAKRHREPLRVNPNALRAAHRFVMVKLKKRT